MPETVNRKIICAHDAHLVLVWNERWLPLETAYPGRLDEARSWGVRLAQAMMLQGEGRSIKPLLIETLLLARSLDIDQIYALVNPERKARWIPFGFHDTGWPNGPWDFADYAEVTALRYDVHQTARRS